MSAISKAIDLAGGPSALAKEIGAKPNQVNNWRHRGVPARYCYAIEKAVDSQVTRQELRPDDWHFIWPELVRQPNGRRSTDKETTR